MSDAEVMRMRVIDATKKRIKATIEDTLKSGTFKTHLLHNVASLLTQMQHQGVLQSFTVDPPEFRTVKPFVEVGDLPVGAKPGDLYVVVEDGNDTYRGLIIACDGSGWGTVFNRRGEAVDQEMTLRCNIQPSATVDYVALQFSVTLPT